MHPCFFTAEQHGGSLEGKFGGRGESRNTIDTTHNKEAACPVSLVGFLDKKAA
jgi:hypothetical protein